MNEIKNKVEQNEVQGTRAERALLESQLSVWQLDVCFVFFFSPLFLTLLMLVGTVGREPSQGPQSPSPFTRSALSSGRWQLSCLGVAIVLIGLSVMH